MIFVIPKFPAKRALLHLSLKNVEQKFSMRLKNPKSLLKGEWIIELPED